jgi:hypothetical protein
MRSKICTGPSHSVPVMLPLTDDYWYFHKTGKRVGKPSARCKNCQNWTKLQNPGMSGTVWVEQIRPHTMELVQRCGTLTAAEKWSSVSWNTLRDIVESEPKRVQKRTARKILEALESRRKYDRKNHETSPALLKARRQQAVLESNLTRMVGY